jgi:hypothetical protein
MASLRLDGRSTDSASRLRSCSVTMATAYQEMGVRLDFTELSACLQDVGWLNGRKTIWSVTFAERRRQGACFLPQGSER